MTAAGLFAGIGGIELGLSKAGFKTELVCEIDPGAAEVLRRRLEVDVHPDVRNLGQLPTVDVVAAGFPCQDLSQAGRTAGIAGKQSRLVGEVFKLLAPRGRAPRWLFLENVPFMLQLQQGRAMAYLVSELEKLGFMWAYRVVDAQSFGIPQRRKRVLLLASRTEDPRTVLFGTDAGAEPSSRFDGKQLCGFYWTEGTRGLGWAVDGIPTLKGGSTLGIPSPPAIWDPLDGSFSIPDIRDAERLQGFASGWTLPAGGIPGVRGTHRWKLVGNAVSVSVAKWLGDRLLSPSGTMPQSVALKSGDPWPKAAWGRNGQTYSVDVSPYPQRRKCKPLREFLRFARTPLSLRASAGFLSRAEQSCLNFEDDFLDDLSRFVADSTRRAAA